MRIKTNLRKQKMIMLNRKMSKAKYPKIIENILMSYSIITAV